MVNRLRGKVGDDAGKPRYIITEPRVGYRMAAGGEREKESSPDSPGDGGSRRGWHSVSDRRDCLLGG